MDGDFKFKVKTWVTVNGNEARFGDNVKRLRLLKTNDEFRSDLPRRQGGRNEHRFRYPIDVNSCFLPMRKNYFHSLAQDGN